VAKVGTSNPDRTISLKMLQCVVENKHIEQVVARFLESMRHVGKDVISKKLHFSGAIT
jgi:rhamnose utilization protein RhaD (predicted bifunctional aldolase and dehydrogenase)